VQIDSKLNLVFPIRTQEVEGKNVPILWAHHTPISTEVFQANYRIIAATKAAIFKRGAGYAADVGPRIASLALRDAGLADAAEMGIEDTVPALLADIRRLTHVLAPGKDGFEMLPIDVAIARKVIDAEEWDECESQVCFFCVSLSMALRSNREAVAKACALVLGGSISSLPPLESVNSLGLSTPGIGSKAEASLPKP
jgi:hypothetical protein